MDSEEDRKDTGSDGSPGPDDSRPGGGGKVPFACLSIAGSDSGGGAGIQADLKSFHANGVYGLTALTSVTAQNTMSVLRAFDLPADLVTAQLAAVFADFEVAAAKTGMLSSSDLVEAVTSFWRELSSPPPLVVDPVMISKSGYPLLRPDAVDRVRRKLLPLATLVTPNLHEAALLAGIEIRTRDDLSECGRRILDMGPKAVLLKGGHLPDAGLETDRSTDTLIWAEGKREFDAPRIDTSSTHGTGCTYSAAICAWLGRGLPLVEAVARAKVYVTGAIRRGLALGHGSGPTNHFYFLEDPARLHGSGA